MAKKKKIEKEVIEHEDYMPEPSEVVYEDAEAAYQEALLEMEVEEAAETEETDAVEIETNTDDNKDVLGWETRVVPLYESDDEEKRIKRLHRFYSVEVKVDKDTDEVMLKKIDLDNYAIVDVLRELGFCRYDQPNGSFEYVHIKDNIITLIRDQQMIVDAFEDYVCKLPTLKYPTGGHYLKSVDREKHIKYMQKSHIYITSEMLLQKVYKNIMYYFSSTLPRLRPDKPIRLLQDTKDSKYLFYNNCVVRISKDGIETYQYDQLDMMLEVNMEDNGKYIWSNNILDRDFPKTYITEDGKSNMKGVSDFEIFINCICGISDGFIEHYDGTHHINYKEMKEQGALLIANQRLWSLQNIFGYLMHNNYECNLKSIMFIDMNKENAGKPAGGTGKGIIGKALSQMMNRTESDSKYIAPPGKNFDPEDERRYSEGDITTQLIHIEDIKKNFQFEAFFNDVTDGAVFRKMYQDKTKHRVKIMLSSNQAIDLSAPSCKRRMVVFELDNFFNENKTPQDMFGKRFFESQWDILDWYRFDIFMANCCLRYMQEKDTVGADGRVIGIRQPPLLNYQNTLLRSKLSEDFITWFSMKIEEGLTYKVERAYSKNALFEEFTKKYTEFANEQKYKRAFTGWCKFYLQTMEIPSGEKRSTEDVLILFPNPDPKISYIYQSR